MAYLYFLACCAVSIGLVSGLTYGLLGNTLTLNPDISAQPHEILWKHNGDKVIEFNGQEERVYRQFQDRVTLDWVTAELDIINLGYEDTGEYVLETYTNMELFSFSFEIEVMGEVPTPTISCDMDKGSSGIHGTQATLTCYAEPTKQHPIMWYEWVSGGNVYPGPKLDILLRDDRDNRIHTCRVSNPVSIKMTTIIARSCYYERQNIDSSSTATIVNVKTIVIVILVCVSIHFCRRKQRALFVGRNVEEQKPLKITGSCSAPFEEQMSPPGLDLSQGDVNLLVEKYEQMKAGQKPTDFGTKSPAGKWKKVQTKSDQVNKEPSPSKLRKSYNYGSVKRKKAKESSEEKKHLFSSSQEDSNSSRKGTHTREEYIKETVAEIQSKTDHRRDKERMEAPPSDSTRSPHRSFTLKEPDSRETNTPEELLNPALKPGPDQGPECTTRRDPEEWGGTTAEADRGLKKEDEETEGSSAPLGSKICSTQETTQDNLSVVSKGEPDEDKHSGPAKNLDDSISEQNEDKDSPQASPDTGPQNTADGSNSETSTQELRQSKWLGSEKRDSQRTLVKRIGFSPNG